MSPASGSSAQFVPTPTRYVAVGGPVRIDEGKVARRRDRSRCSGSSTRRRRPTGGRPCRRPGRRGDRRGRRRRNAKDRRRVQVSCRAVPSCCTSSRSPSSTGVRMFPLSKSCTTVFCCVLPSAEDAAIATPGTSTVATAATAIQRCVTGPLVTGSTRAPSRRGERRDEQRDRGEEQEIRGPRGHQQPPERAGLDRRERREALHDEERGEPAAEEGCDRAAPDAYDREQPGERRPLGEPLAPEELAERVHLVAPVLEVEVEVAVELQVDREVARACRHAGPRRARTREPDPARAPSRSRRTSNAGAIATPHARPSRQRRATTYASDRAARDEQVRRLQRRGGADEHACEHGVRDAAGLQRPHDEQRAREHEHHRREVGHRGEPERLREELLGPALLVTVDEQRDRGERRDHPQERRPVARAAARRSRSRSRRRRGARSGRGRASARPRARAAPGRTSARSPT